MAGTLVEGDKRMTATKLAEVIEVARDAGLLLESDELWMNSVGNLSVMRPVLDSEHRTYVGWLDFSTEVFIWL